MLKLGMRRAALLLGIGCAACCALPLMGLGAAGALALGLAFVCSHWLLVAACFMLLSVGWLLIRRQKAMACDLNGPCNPT